MVTTLRPLSSCEQASTYAAHALTGGLTVEKTCGAVLDAVETS
jgi:hypothetical protein